MHTFDDKQKDVHDLITYYANDLTGEPLRPGIDLSYALVEASPALGDWISTFTKFVASVFRIGQDVPTAKPEDSRTFVVEATKKFYREVIGPYLSRSVSLFGAIINPFGEAVAGMIGGALYDIFTKVRAPSDPTHPTDVTPGGFIPY